MANGNNSHPLTWPAIVGAGGLMLGVGGSVIFVGSSLRQIEVNTHRLDALEQNGSPIVQAIKADLQSARISLADVQTIARTNSDNDKGHDRNLARIDEAIKQLTNDVRTLEIFSRDTAERRAALAAEVAAGQGRVAALEKGLEDTRGELRRAVEQAQKHQAEDESQLRDELNQLRGARLENGGGRMRYPPTPDAK